MLSFALVDDINKHSSLITHLLSQVRLGMDLTKVSQFLIKPGLVINNHGKIQSKILIWFLYFDQCSKLTVSCATRNNLT